MWSIINNNFICSEKELFRVNKIHLEKLLNSKSNLNNKASETPYFLKNKSYLREIIRAKELKRNNDNNIMLKRLIFMATSPSPYSKSNTPKYCPAFDKQRFNFGKIEREINIYNDNISFYKRFSKKKPYYSAKQFFIKNDYENIIKNNISRSKFLPKIALKLCTYRQFKSNLLKESNKIKESIKKLAKSNKTFNKELRLNRSKSVYNLLHNKKYKILENLRYNDKFLNNINNNLSSKELEQYKYFNSKNIISNIQNLQRSQSALNIKYKNNKNFK